MVKKNDRIEAEISAEAPSPLFNETYEEHLKRIQVSDPLDRLQKALTSDLWKIRPELFAVLREISEISSWPRHPKTDKIRNALANLNAAIERELGT